MGGMRWTLGGVSKGGDVREWRDGLVGPMWLVRPRLLKKASEAIGGRALWQTPWSL